MRASAGLSQTELSWVSPANCMRRIGKQSSYTSQPATCIAWAGPGIAVLDDAYAYCSWSAVNTYIYHRRRYLDRIHTLSAL
jgi:hypothetical protein